MSISCFVCFLGCSPALCTHVGLVAPPPSHAWALIALCPDYHEARSQVKAFKERQLANKKRNERRQELEDAEVSSLQAACGKLGGERAGRTLHLIKRVESALAGPVCASSAARAAEVPSALGPSVHHPTKSHHHLCTPPTVNLP